MQGQTPRTSATRPAVLVVAHRIDREGQGMERLHARLAESLSVAYDIHVLVGAIDEETARFVTVHKVPLIERPIPVRFMMFSLLASLRLFVLKNKVDLVHSCGAIVFNRVDLVSLHLCQAALIHANGGRRMPPSGSLLRRVNTGLLKTMALSLERHAFAPKRRTTAAAVSEQGLEEVATWYPRSPRVLTENGVDGQDFGPNMARREEVRTALGLDADTFLILQVGGDWTLRGVDLAIRSLETLPGTAKLCIVGRGDRPRMHRLACELGVDDRVMFLGARHDVADLYRGADVLVQLSAYETFSLVLVEAALSELPLVTTAVGVAMSLCGDNESGGLVVDRSATAVAAGLQTVMEQRVDTRRRVEMALERAQRFTLVHLATQLDSVYRELLVAS